MIRNDQALFTRALFDAALLLSPLFFVLVRFVCGACMLSIVRGVYPLAMLFCLVPQEVFAMISLLPAKRGAHLPCQVPCNTCKLGHPPTHPVTT